MVRHYRLTLTANQARRLSEVYGGAPLTPAAADDLPCRQIFVQGNAVQTVVVGSSAAVSLTDYGFKTVQGSTADLVIGPYETGPVKLSDFWALSDTNGAVRILTVPY